MKQEMVRTNVYLTSAERSALKRTAKLARICPAALLRKILDEYFALEPSVSK
jgi:hypothetical protein